MNDTSPNENAPINLKLYIWRDRKPVGMPSIGKAHSVSINNPDLAFNYVYVFEGEALTKPIKITKRTDVIVDVVSEPWGSANVFSCLINKLAEDYPQNLSSKLCYFKIVDATTHLSGTQIPIAKPDISGGFDVEAHLNNKASALFTINPYADDRQHTIFKLTVFALYEYAEKSQVIIPCDPEFDNDRD